MGAGLPIRLALPAMLVLALALPTAAACEPALVGESCGSPPPPGPVGDACVFAGGADALLADLHALGDEWVHYATGGAAHLPCP